LNPPPAGPPAAPPEPKCPEAEYDTELVFSTIFSFVVAPLLGHAGIVCAPFAGVCGGGRVKPVALKTPAGSACADGAAAFYAQGPPKWTDLPHPGSLRFLGAANAHDHARGLQRRALLAASWAAAFDNGVAFPRDVASAPSGLVARALPGAAHRGELSAGGARFGAILDALLPENFEGLIRGDRAVLAAASAALADLYPPGGGRPRLARAPRGGRQR
jgi:hypothetical protein